MTHTSAFLHQGIGKQSVSELKQGQLMERCHKMEFSCCHEQKEEWASQSCKGGEQRVSQSRSSQSGKDNSDYARGHRGQVPKPLIPS